MSRSVTYSGYQATVLEERLGAFLIQIPSLDGLVILATKDELVSVTPLTARTA